MTKANARAAIRRPEILHIRDGESISYGANQEWYEFHFGRRGGCGPTCTSNIMWYLASTRPETCGKLAANASDRRGMLRLMNDVWHFVKPGFKGVHRASILVNGAVGYAASRGVSLYQRVLEVPRSAEYRPNIGDVTAFLTSAFAADLPVAFLNLSSGAVKEIDNWHWMTLVALEGTYATMYDDSERDAFDLKLWLESTALGGAFVALYPR